MKAWRVDEKSRLSEFVYESLTQFILSGELEPGRPVSEVALARRLEVSRTPVHEAVKQLVKDGLIAQDANRRPVVVSFTSDDILEIYEMRKILESEAASRAALHIDRSTLERLEKTASDFDASRKRGNTIARWVALDDEFHSAIANASRTRRLAEDIHRYRMLHRVFNRSHTDPSVLERAAKEHRAILAALRKRDAKTARAAMLHHLDEWQRFFVTHLGREFDQTLSEPRKARAL